MKSKVVRVKNNIVGLIRRGEAYLISHRYVSGVTVIEMVLILVKNLALYIEYIEGEKTVKNKLYTRYTQEHGQLILSKKGK